MARPHYPLEALRKLRSERAEAQALRLAQQIGRAEAAQTRLHEAERARREHEARTRSTLESERQRVLGSGASGADLLRIAEFETASRTQAQLLGRAEQALREQLQAEREAERRERAELSRLEAEAKLVHSHATQFHEHQAELTLKAEEETALEQWNARRH